MWIIRTALRHPYTFFVMAILIVLFGSLSALRTPVDILPDIKLPVISVVWTYIGMPPADMSNRIITYYERQMTTAVTDIDHIESQSLPGVGVVKVFFHPDVNVNAALSEVIGISQTVLKRLPPGITPPQILSYNASSVPVLQLALSGKSLTDQQLYDLSNNFIRPRLAEVEGAAVPSPYGGKARQVQVDLDPAALHAKNVTPEDVVNAVQLQNLLLPAGTEKIGKFEYQVMLNASTDTLDELNDLPIKHVDGTVVYLHDVAHVRDGYSPQQNLVRVNGQHSVLTTIQKNGSVSTLSIISQVKELLPLIKAGAPAGLHIGLVGDQSIFVKAAVTGVAREGVIAAVLTALMILLFLGSFRSTLIITVSIPLAVLTSILCLSMLGQTINVMTLGGLALAVGILVDDPTVTIENINWHLEQGKATQQAILDGGQQIIIPALFSFLSISIVFVPMFYLQGVARYLFVPMAEAVVFALLGSFILSRTLVPVLAKYLLEGHDIGNVHRGESGDRSKSNVAVRLQQRFERGVTDARRLYTQVLRLAMGRRAVFVGGFLAFVVISVAVLEPWLGENFFPSVDSGEIKLHVRAQPGTRIEETARLCDQIEGTIRRIIPSSQLDSIIDNIGLPISGINISYSNSAPIGAADADVLIKLKGSHAPTDDYVKLLRERLPRMYPEATYAFLPADIVSQILNFGMPAPIDVQVVGFKRDENARYAQMLLSKLRYVTGIADLRMQQTFDQPVLNVKVDRIRATEVGLTQRDIANSMLVSLSGSAQVSPNFWVNPSNKVSYPLVAQIPQYRLNTLSDLANIPVSGTAGSQPQLLGAVATITQGRAEGVVSHYDVQPTMDLYATVQGRDLGAVTSDINSILQQTANQVPGGSTVVIRGQVQTMNQSYVGLLLGIAGAFVLIYLLLVVDFQSWRDPFIVISALPAALAGITWILFVTGTTLSVPALTGAMMSMGVGTANSILVVSFAREQLALGRDPITAAIEAGATRFRPVLMTALAMIIGMIPMALAMGEGGEQNAPLGRAVIGGLLFATVATLIFVPVVFSLLHRHDAPAGDGAAAAPALPLAGAPHSTLSPT